MRAAMSSVTITRFPLTLPTYEPLPPDRNPLFLERRVYQGSRGRVYPLPVVDRIADTPRDRAWAAVQIENEFLRVLVLPEIGGRIHAILDRTNGYDLVYRQEVIKPALVGLAGPWASGGIEFNWPQHHRPSTFQPADVAIEEHPDGAKTIWLSEHDPLARMKGMHGVCLHADRAVVELKVRLYNRTPHTQTFLWWANVATRVHERYQSFFPPDVTHVADHARRAMSTYPLCTGRYYGVDYATRVRHGVPAAETPTQFVPPPGRYRPDDLSWYANIPVPTSYMCLGSQQDFFGGYDHARAAGLVHVANHHIAPGKKQWTWGNHPFGYAWDRNLTDPDAKGVCAPYIELMAGVYTDNQPDFSFLQPYETKTWSQYWYPIQQTGPVQQANVEAALSLHISGRQSRIGAAVTRAQPGATLIVTVRGRPLARKHADLAPGRPIVTTVRLPRGAKPEHLQLRLLAADGRELIAHAPRPKPAADAPAPATEPAAPADVASNDELHLIGVHLEQYRHATRSPEPYWHEALRRDPGDARCHVALGRRHLQRGEFPAAEKHLRAAIARLTSRNANPADGEAHYQLGLTLRYQDRDDEAYAALYKATWNHAWQPAGFHALAEIDCARRDWPAALDHLERALRGNVDNLKARDLRALVLRRLGRAAEAEAALRATLALDPLDWWARDLLGERLGCDAQVRLDLAHDYARAGFFAEGIAVLTDVPTPIAAGAEPRLHYARAWLESRRGRHPAARRALRAARLAPPDYCFPASLDDLVVLTHALREQPGDARAAHYLGNLLYDRRRHREAIAQWERAARGEPRNAVNWRNLGIAYFNVLRQPARARRAYDRAHQAAPADARILYERDQLWKRTGESPARRLRELERHAALVATRDDLSVELGLLLLQNGRPLAAQALLAGRRFQPWEGGEGQVLGLHVRTHIMLGQLALAEGRAADAQGLIATALTAPTNLGEAKHLHANQSDVHYWLGRAFAAGGDARSARAHWARAADARGDFQGMSTQAYSEMTYYSAEALLQLGRRSAARSLLRGLLAHARALRRAPATIDYFATSLPTLLLFEDDLTARQQTAALFLEAQARLGLGERAAAKRLLATVLRRDANHLLARELQHEIAGRRLR